MQLPSTLLENAVAEFSKLPGIGKKTALRLVLHLLKQEEATTNHFSEALVVKIVSISAMAPSVLFVPMLQEPKKPFAWWKTSEM